MTDIVALARLLDDAEIHGLVVKALESAMSDFRSADCDSEADRRHFARVSSILDVVVAALHEPNVRLSEPGDTFDDILTDRGARETLRSALMTYGQAVLEVWETSIDVSVRGTCELATSNIEWALETIEGFESATEARR